MSDPLVEALRRLVEREGGRHVVASRIRVNEQTLYQIIRGIPLPSGKPRGVGATLRAKLTAAYPDWLELAAHEKDSPNTSRARAQPIEDALPAVLDAIRHCPPQHREELRSLLSLLVDHDAPAYRQRLGELLSSFDPRGPNLTTEDKALAARVTKAAQMAESFDVAGVMKQPVKNK